MQNNKILNEELPNDLMSFKELQLKHNFDYDYLYKKSVEEGAIRLYMRGVWKLSENEVLKFAEKIKEEKLNKLKIRKGGN